jgi:hypothetical protein
MKGKCLIVNIEGIPDYTDWEFLRCEHCTNGMHKIFFLLYNLKVSFYYKTKWFSLKTKC